MGDRSIKNKKHFKKVWQADLANDLISIGWSQLGDVSQMSQNAILKAITANYSKGMHKRDAADMLWTFYHDIKPGHFVIARRGLMTLAAIGKVIKTAKYDAEKHSLYGISEVTYP